MKEVLKRFTSRKFLLALGTCVVLYANGQYDQILWVVLAYLGVEGSRDTVEAFASTKYVAPQKSRIDALKSITEEDDVDRSTIVPGGFSSAE